MKEVLINIFKKKPAMFIIALVLLLIAFAIIYYTVTGEGAYFTYLGRNSGAKSQLMRHYCEINNISPSLCGLKHDLYCSSHFIGNIIFVISMALFCFSLPKNITGGIKYYFLDYPEYYEGTRFELVVQILKYILIIVVISVLSIYLAGYVQDNFKNIDITIINICWFLIWMTLSAFPFMSIMILSGKSPYDN